MPGVAEATEQQVAPTPSPPAAGAPPPVSAVNAEAFAEQRLRPVSRRNEPREVEPDEEWDRPRRATAESSSSLGLILTLSISGGILLIGAIILAVVLTTREGPVNDFRPPEVVINQGLPPPQPLPNPPVNPFPANPFPPDPLPVVKPPPVLPPPDPPKNQGLVPNAAVQPPRPRTPVGKPVIDLVPRIDPVRDAIHGRWAVANNVLHCNDAHFVPRVQIPYRPPREYDFIVTFSQPSLRNGISLIMPNPNGGGSFFWYLGGGQGSDFGFWTTLRKGKPLPGLIQAGTAYSTTVQVRRNGVKGLVNGKVLMSHRTDFRDLTCDNWRQLRDTTLLGVACDDPTVFHYVWLVEITGKGTPVQ
jgi:hypothetical protein